MISSYSIIIFLIFSLGGSEDIMLSKVLNVTDEQVKEAIASLLATAEEQKLTDKIIFEDVGSISEALQHWEACIRKAGFENLLIPTGPLGKELIFHIYAVSNTCLGSKCHEVKFEDFVQLATTMDGVKVSHIHILLIHIHIHIHLFYYLLLILISKVWSVEDDMQLAEVISRVAEREVIFK